MSILPDSCAQSKFVRLAVALLAWAAFFAAPAPALADAADVEAAARGVVRVIIIGSDGDEIFPISHGTGFAVGGERVITNAHVVAEAMEDERLSIGIVPPEGGDAVYARLVSVSPRNDLALIEATEPMRLPALTIAGNPPRGSGAVTAIGYPMNVDKAQGLGSRDIFRATPPVTSTGFLSGRRPSREFDTLLHTAPIARGNSGGPLVDDCGRLIGVNSFGAESEGTEAEFFFAITTRELLPFLRANNVSPRLNALPCRSIAELDAEAAAREKERREAEEARAASEAEAQARRSEELRRTIMYEQFDARSDRNLLVLILLIIGTAAGGFAVISHQQGQLRARAIAGGVAVVALLLALGMWLTRPAFKDIETRLEEALRSEMDASETGVIKAPVAGSAQETAFTCVLEPERSRVTGAPEQDVPLKWSADGCVNGRTQYGLSAGGWTRVLVPASEAAVSVNRFDPEAREYVVERYLLDRNALTDARSARATYQTPQCEGDEEAARKLGSDQEAILLGLPAQPNERLVYSCAPDSESAVDN